MTEPKTDERVAYETIKNMKEKYGTYHKTCFHIHTPASHDYQLLHDWSDAYYKSASDQDIYNLCIEKHVFPKTVPIEQIPLDGNYSCYQNKKELLSYFLLAETIIENDIEVVLVCDHNTIDGVNKLRTAVNELHRMKSPKFYPEVLLGIEISCADKNHVVGIFEDNKTTRKEIQKWLNNHLISNKEGTYETGIVVLEFIKSIKGIGYLAHFDNSDSFKEAFLSGAYKKRLFSESVLQLIGLTDYNKLDKVRQYIRNYRKAGFKVVLDNDAHDIDSIPEKTFWIKGSDCSFVMVKEALTDYDISVSFEQEPSPKQYIKGIYIQNEERGFLIGQEKQGFCLRFSKALNCLIGGRGTGKSTVLELLEYVLSQRCDNEKRLDFICAHGDTWLLYDYQGEEYLIEMRMPVKPDPDDNILRCFGQNLSDRYGFKYYYKPDMVREYAYKQFLKISRVIQKDGKWYLETVSNKKEMLNRFFDVRYSVNELVKTAGGEGINDFIYKTLFENKTLSRPEDVIRFKRKKGLAKALDDTQSILQKREQEVNAIITPFNESQANTLRILYSQDTPCKDPDIAFWLFGVNYKQHRWYKKHNIYQESLIDYLLILYDRLGIFEFIKMVINKDVDRAFSIACLKDFCTEMNQQMVEEGIIAIDEIMAKEVLMNVFSNLINNNNIESIKQFLKNYVTDIERFSLEFNVNNKEGTKKASAFRPVGELSLGQKVVAMLSFVLGYSDYSNDYRPLIIDQPEDNLDNQYIYKNLVKQLRSIKEKRQVIVATHNATIVTNAKADQVCIMCSDNQHGWIEMTGYPGEKRIKKQILNYLEGGEDSFIHKVSIYEDALGLQMMRN